MFVDNKKHDVKPGTLCHERGSPDFIFLVLEKEEKQVRTDISQYCVMIVQASNDGSAISEVCRGWYIFDKTVILFEP